MTRGGARLIPPLAVAGAVIATAPFMGQVRDLLLDWFPEGFARILGAAFLLAIAGALAWALVRIRSHRLARYAGLAAGLGLLAAGVLAFGTGQPRVDAVERIHVLEYGLLALLFYRALAPLGDFRALAYPWLATTLAGILDEGVQWLVATRVGDVRDVALNAGSGLAGLLFAVSLSPPAAAAWRPTRAALAPILGAAAVVALAFAGFFRLAHFGFWIEDPEVGRFRSWFSRAGLVAAAEDRRARWAARPPGPARPLDREDYFLTEAAWHVNHRNASLERGDLATAGCENRILERYFEPMLELRSPRGGSLYRLAEEHRREAEKAAAGRTRGGYRSRVLRQRVFPLMSPRAYWAATAAALAGLLALAWCLRRPVRS